MEHLLWGNPKPEPLWATDAPGGCSSRGSGPWWWLSLPDLVVPVHVIMIIMIITTSGRTRQIKTEVTKIKGLMKRGTGDWESGVSTPEGTVHANDIQINMRYPAQESAAATAQTTANWHWLGPMDGQFAACCRPMEIYMPSQEPGPVFFYPSLAIYCTLEQSSLNWVLQGKILLSLLSDNF